MKKFRNWLFRYSYTIYIGILFLLMLVMVFYQSIFIDILPGERGIIWHRFAGGTNMDRIYREGMKVIAPWDILYIYDTRVQAVSDTVGAIMGEGMVVTLGYTLHFRPRLDSLARLHQVIGPDYVEKIIIPEANSAARAVLSRIGPDSVYNISRSEIQDSMKATIIRELDDRFVNFQDILIRDIQLPDSVREAINNKLVLEQRFLAYEYRILSEEKEAQRKLIEAKGVKAFEDSSGISILQWRGIQATENIAKSENAKVIVIGTDSKDLPIILGGGN